MPSSANGNCRDMCEESLILNSEIHTIRVKKGEDLQFAAQCQPVHSPPMASDRASWSYMESKKHQNFKHGLRKC